MKKKNDKGLEGNYINRRKQLSAGNIKSKSIMSKLGENRAAGLPISHPSESKNNKIAVERLKYKSISKPIQKLTGPYKTCYFQVEVCNSLCSSFLCRILCTLF